MTTECHRGSWLLQRKYSQINILLRTKSANIKIRDEYAKITLLYFAEVIKDFNSTRIMIACKLNYVTVLRLKIQ